MKCTHTHTQRDKIKNRNYTPKSKNIKTNETANQIDMHVDFIMR